VARISRPETAPRHRASRSTSGIELVQKLSQAFDPSAQRARDDERAQRSLQSAQFLSLSQQLRDAQGTTEALRSQVTELQTRLHTTESARDRAELKLEMVELSQGFRARAPFRSSSASHPMRKVNHNYHHEWYPDGGPSISEPGSTDDEGKENIDPSIYSRYTRPRPIPRFRSSVHSTHLQPHEFGKRPGQSPASQVKTPCYSPSKPLNSSLEVHPSSVAPSDPLIPKDTTILDFALPLGQSSRAASGAVKD